MKERQRENWIDLVKCVAMFIVVMNHAQWIIPGVNFLGGMFFVPVFFVLSGYTWQDKGEAFSVVIKKRAKRLLLPYVVSNLFLCTFGSLKNGSLLSGDFASYGKSLLGVLYARNQFYQESSAPNYTLYPNTGYDNIYFYKSLNSPTWFLPALFLTLICFELTYQICQKKQRRVLLMLLLLYLVAVLFHYIFPILLPWSIDALPMFLLLFYFGYQMKQKDWLDLMTKKPWILLSSVLVFAVAVFLNRSANFSIGMYSYSVTLAMLNAVISSVLIMWILRILTRPFAQIPYVMGKHTLLILCYHLFVLAVLDVVMPAVPVACKVIITLVALTLAGVILDKLKYRKS